MLSSNPDRSDLRNDGHWSRAPGDEGTIIRPGRNAWRVATAERLSFLVDGQAYFHALEAALEQAHREIWIVGWDFNPDIVLRPEDAASQTLGDLLFDLVERRPELTIRILIWAMGPVYSGKSLRMFGWQRWSSHPRIVLHFDGRHPIRGSHHQKLVVIDDRLAFVGGLDLTAKRWDTNDHTVEDPRRRLPSGKPYDPVHDLQVALEGEAAQAAGEIARRRWLLATDEVVTPCPAVGAVTLDGLVPDLVGSPVAFARTEPAIRGREGCGEAMELTLDALRAARRHIYIESQYFASDKVCRILCDKLAEPGGPEVVIVTTLSSHGMIERLVLGANRDRFVRRLGRYDRHGRLRAGYPVIPKRDGSEQEIVVHSKLVVVDDRFLRIGSSNLNQRSERLDTELDVAIEAHSPQERASVRGLRDRLLAEHLDAEPDAVAAMVEESGSLTGTVDALNVKPRGLRPFAEANGRGAVRPVVGTGLVDPVAPWWPLSAAADSAAAFLRRQFGLLRRPAALLDPNSASLAKSETSPNGSGMKK